jgi:hypothetical protein
MPGSCRGRLQAEERDRPQPVHHVGRQVVELDQDGALGYGTTITLYCQSAAHRSDVLMEMAELVRRNAPIRSMRACFDARVSNALSKDLYRSTGGRNCFQVNEFGDRLVAVHGSSPFEGKGSKLPFVSISC